jgi:hypothetical protein
MAKPETKSKSIIVKIAAGSLLPITLIKVVVLKLAL